jgi:hypothetical protein
LAALALVRPLGWTATPVGVDEAIEEEGADITKSPWASVTAATTAPVTVLVASTIAPWSAAPVASVTVP